MARKVGRWRDLQPAAWWYLLHVALLTISQTGVSLFFNLAILSYGLSRADLGWLNLVSIWASVLLSLPLWYAVTRFGLRNSLVIHALVQALVVAVYASSHSLIVLACAAALGGAVSVLFQVSAAPLMMRASDAHSRDMLFSANTGIAITLSGVASLFAGVLPALFGRWFGVAAENASAYQATFALAAIGMALSALPLLFLPNDRPVVPVTPSPARAQSTVSQTDWRSLHGWWARIPPIYQHMLRRPLPLLALLLVPALISIGAALLIPYQNLFFKQHFAVSDAALGVIFALLDLSAGIAVLFGPALSSRIGKIPALVITQLLSLPFLLVMGFVPVLGISVAAAMLRGALFNLGRPLYDAFAMEHTAEAARPTVTGLLGGAATLGYLFAPPLSVWLQAKYGFTPIFAITAACYTLAVVVTAALFWRPGGGVVARWYNTPGENG